MLLNGGKDISPVELGDPLLRRHPQVRCTNSLHFCSSILISCSDDVETVNHKAVMLKEGKCININKPGRVCVCASLLLLSG